MTIERIVNYEIDEDPKAQELWVKRVEDGWMAVDLNAARLEVSFQPCSAGSDLIRALESVHALG